MLLQCTALKWWLSWQSISSIGREVKTSNTTRHHRGRIYHKIGALMLKNIPDLFYHKVEGGFVPTLEIDGIIDISLVGQIQLHTVAQIQLSTSWLINPVCIVTMHMPSCVMKSGMHCMSLYIVMTPSRRQAIACTMSHLHNDCVSSKWKYFLSGKMIYFSVIYI